MRIAHFFLLLPFVLVVTILSATVPAAAHEIKHLSRCVVDFSVSIEKRGHKGEQVGDISKDMWRQMVAIHDSLPEECQDKCVFDNITQTDWMIITKRKWVDGFIPEELLKTFEKQCQIHVNTEQSLLQPFGKGSCSGNNALTLTIIGGNNSFSGIQVGCNVASVVINGNDIHVDLAQLEQNRAYLSFFGSGYDFVFHQTEDDVFTGSFGSGGQYLH